MFWFRRPPYLRWLGAAVLIGAGLVAEFRPTAMVVHPFVVEAVEPGMPLTQVEWREVPAGLLPPLPDLGDLVAHRHLEEGEPVLAASIGPATATVPAGWWALRLEVPALVGPGTPAQVIVTDPPAVTEGLVVSVASPDPFSATGPTALVAVPPATAPAVAAGAAAGRAIVLVTPPK